MYLSYVITYIQVGSQQTAEYVRLDTFLGKISLNFLLFSSYFLLNLPLIWTYFCLIYPYFTCILDLSTLPFPLEAEVSCDALRTVRVKGIVVDAKGLPTGYPISANKVISCCLLAGTSSVQRTGKVVQVSHNISANLSNSRRRSMNVNAGQYTARTTATQSYQPTDLSSPEDLPITLNCDHLHDWSVCRPNHRHSLLTPLEDGRLAVSVPEHPVTWVFSRTNSSTGGGMTERGSDPPTADQTSVAVTTSTTTGVGAGMGGGSGGGNLYLVEIHYHLKLETGLVSNIISILYIYICICMCNICMFTISWCLYFILICACSLYTLHFILTLHYYYTSYYTSSYTSVCTQPVFVPHPRHALGELARTVKGCELLIQYKTIDTLLHTARDDHATEISRKSALWSLGQICARGTGYDAVNEYDSRFVEWCIRTLHNANSYSLRGTLFHILGLIGRSKGGAERLNELGWITSPAYSHSAVAIPTELSTLFNSASHAVDDFTLHSGHKGQGQGQSGTTTSTGTGQQQMHIDVSSIIKNLSSQEKEVIELVMKVRG